MKFYTVYLMVPISTQCSNYVNFWFLMNTFFLNHVASALQSICDLEFDGAPLATLTCMIDM